MSRQALKASNISSKTAKLIAISGGIGSGKSIVCRVLKALGYTVYDCDSEAKAIMDADASIKSMIAERIAPRAINPDGSINRPVLAAEVFASPHKLQALNSAVHGAVRADIARRAAECPAGIMFVETAILYPSGLDSMVDTVWEVTAPTPLRVRRVMKRNAFTENQVLDRIAVQDSYNPEHPHPSVHRLTNDDTTPLLPQIEALLLNS